MLYFPLISVAPEYFDRRRGAAMGVILSAAGVGGLVYSLALRVLLDRVGARWTLRILSLESLLVGLPIAMAALPSRSTNIRPTFVDWRIARKPAFVLQALAAMLQAAGNFVPMTFTPEFTIALGYTAAFGAVLLSVNNGVNAVSRVLTGVLADALGRQNILILSVVGSAVSVLALWLSAAMYDANGLWVAFVVLYGILAGGKRRRREKTPVRFLFGFGLIRGRVHGSLPGDHFRGLRHTSIRFRQQLRILCARLWSSVRFACWRADSGRFERLEGDGGGRAIFLSETHLVRWCSVGRVLLVRHGRQGVRCLGKETVEMESLNGRFHEGEWESSR